MSETSSYTPPPPPPPPPPGGSYTPPPPPPPGGTPGGAAPNSDRTIMVILSYLWILGLIPLLAKKDDPEVQWHAKNGLAFLGAEIVVWIVCMILGFALRRIFVALSCGLGLVECVVWLGFSPFACFVSSKVSAASDSAFHSSPTSPRRCSQRRVSWIRQAVRTLLHRRPRRAVPTRLHRHPRRVVRHPLQVEVAATSSIPSSRRRIRC